MKIWIINPPFQEKAVREGRCMQRKEMWSSLWPPTSLAYTAAVLRKDGHEIEAWDCIASDISKEAFFSASYESLPRLTIVNTSTPTIESDMDFVRGVKGMFPETIVAVIGIHPSALPHDCIEAGADIAVIGEPENSARVIAKAIEEGSNSYEGASFAKKDDNGDITVSLENSFGVDLDLVPFPAWDLFDLSKYLMPGKDMRPKRFLTVTPSRGCPYSCSFCNAASYYGKKTRFRDPKKIVDEIEHNMTEFGIRDFLIWTESFTLDKERAKGICDEIIRRGIRADWVCNSRTDAVSPELLSKMKEAGCWMISFGIESGSQMILDRAKKGASVEDSERAVAITRKAGLKTVAHTIIGLPGETEESVAETSKLLNRIKTDFAQFYLAVPFPGSDLYTEARREGWIEDGAEWIDFEQTRSVMNIPTMTAVCAVRLKNKAYLSHYLNIPRIIRILKGSSIKGIFFAARNAIILVVSEISSRRK